MVARITAQTNPAQQARILGQGIHSVSFWKKGMKDEMYLLYTLERYLVWTWSIANEYNVLLCSIRHFHSNQFRLSDWSRFSNRCPAMGSSHSFDSTDSFKMHSHGGTCMDAECTKTYKQQHTLWLVRFPTHEVSARAASLSCTPSGCSRRIWGPWQAEQDP